MYLIDRDQLLQALKDHIDRHGVYRHSYERMGIEQLILSIDPTNIDSTEVAKSNSLEYIDLLSENKKLKQRISQLEEIIDTYKSRIAAISETKNDLPSKMPIKTDRQDILRGLWKKQQRFKLYDAPWGGLRHDIIDVYVCNRCGFTLGELSGNTCSCPKCGSLNELYQSE